jgi:hypothetical protein
MLRRLRGRFGISAPQVAIRTHVPWHLRAFGIGVIVAVLLGVTAWVFDFGRQFAGFNQSELSALQAANAAQEQEVARLRGLLATSENNLQIEKAAQKQLTDKHGVLVEENTRLKEELAVLERLSKTGKR